MSQKSVGTWLWSELMDWCKERGIAPATQDRLFAIVGKARAEFDIDPAWEKAWDDKSPQRGS